ncbi:MAG: alpha/beta hydrolase [Pseudomonadota bacterium]
MSFPKLALSLFVLILLGTALVQWRAGAREAAARAAFPPEGQLIEVNGRTVHAVVMGEGPDLVLIHGSSGNTRDFTFELAETLAPNYRLFIFDRPGLGWSDRLPRGAEGIAEQAAHLKAAADALGARRPLVLGQSYGGAVALAWATQFPSDTAGLITVAGASHRWDGETSLLYRATATWAGSTFLVPLIAAFVPQSYVDDSIQGVFVPQNAPEGYAEYIGAPLSITRDALRATAAQRVSIKSEIIAMEPAYPNLTLPQEIVHGSADRIVWIEIHAERMIKDTDQANLTRLEGIGHMPHHVAQTQVIDAIDRAATRARLR